MVAHSAADSYVTSGGISVIRSREMLPYSRDEIDRLTKALDGSRGVVLTSGFEFPGRYTRWDLGFQNPMLQIVARGRSLEVEALNSRGAVLLGAIQSALAAAGLVAATIEDKRLMFEVPATQLHFPEELRSRQPSVFSALRELIHVFGSSDDPHLGLYGAWGYDLVRQFEPLPTILPREKAHRDLVLYLPDEIVVVDHARETASQMTYEFDVPGQGSTRGLPRNGERDPFRKSGRTAWRDHELGEYADLVNKAKEYFRRGDLFEVVPGQAFFEPCRLPPSQLFRDLCERNPAPYGALMNLGEQEYLVAASPEMFVRVDGRRVETCPISGTIARGEDVIGDAANIGILLESEKDAAELTMCTDVDRNDKSRICEPESVQILGRRQIEMYSHVIHTVDHVEGVMRPEFDAIDAFLTHMWAVTVTGAPKIWAMRFIEEHERSPRSWYGGAIGYLGFDGDMNTGLTLRTIQVRDGVAQIRAGGTLLVDSDPQAEERETEIKADAFMMALRGTPIPEPRSFSSAPRRRASGSVLLLDHEDSFVHTLAGYFRRCGMDVNTYRVTAPFSERLVRILQGVHPDLVVLSPGPGSPADFEMSEYLPVLLSRGIPIFGVCLGLQGLAEQFGGSLGQLTYPVHGKATPIRVIGGLLLADLPQTFLVGRYHSLYAQIDSLPEEIEVTAVDDAGIVMAIEHKDRPIWAVQFHPESLLTLRDNVGLSIISRVVDLALQVQPSLALEKGMQ